MKNFLHYWSSQLSLYGWKSIFGAREWEKLPNTHIESRLYGNVRIYSVHPGEVKKQK